MNEGANQTTVSRSRGLTLAELLVAMTIAGVILAAAATLSYAIGAAHDSMGDTSQTQAQVRQATLRISDLIRHSRLVCRATSDDLAVWKADDNGDGRINITELAYIEWGAGRDRLRICEFSSADATEIALVSVDKFATNWWSSYSSSADFVELVPSCANVKCSLDESPPLTGLVALSFELVENGVSRQYQIVAGLRNQASNVLNATSDAIVSDDD